MAGYRPKSLDELNNLYGKAMSAENEIKKNSSLLKEEVLKGGFDVEAEPQQTAFRAGKPKEISGDIDDFIRQFSAEGEPSAKGSGFETRVRRPSALADLQPSKTAAPAAPAAPSIEPLPKVEPPKVAESERTQEQLSGLISDYARVMSGDYDDEDDDEELNPRKNLFKSRRSERRGRKRAAKDIVSDGELPQSAESAASDESALLTEPVAQSEPAKPTEPAKPVEPVFTPSFNGDSGATILYRDSRPEEPPRDPNEPLFTLPEDDTEAPEFGEPSLPEYEPPRAESADIPFGGEPKYEPQYGGNDEGGDPDSDYDPALDEPYERPDTDDDFEFGGIEPKRRTSRGVVFAKIALSLVLILTLLATAATGACVFTVNSDRALFGDYLIFSASNTYEDADVNSDDFVICKKQSPIEDDERVIYIDREQLLFSFGIKDGEKTDRNGNEFYIVSSTSIERNDVLGVIVKTVPTLGRFVRAVVDNFLYVLLGLVLLAIVVTLILCFAFKKRDDFDFDAFDGEEGDSGHGTDPDTAPQDFDDDSLFSSID